MIFGIIISGTLCAGILSGVVISRAISMYEELHSDEEWGDDEI